MVINALLHQCVFLSAPIVSHVVTETEAIRSMCAWGQSLAPKHCALHKAMSGCLPSLLLFPGCQNKKPSCDESMAGDSQLSPGSP